ncbi:MAG TPA: sugar phosphate nucleotidyltransferase, partial [Nitrospiraceae bacterium]|nr:sugar phosphate nucleotidyltransferase [Nitrospiraceae bacterium]
MKVVLFCGGLGTRLREHSDTIPKPLVNIGHRPILWHLMRYYAHFGHKEFILCLGYRGDMVRKYFLQYEEAMTNDFTLRAKDRHIELHSRDLDDWKITFVDTGLHSNIGQRLLRVRKYVENEEMFLANYADGLSDLPLDRQLKEFQHRRLVASLVAIRSSQSFHAVYSGQDGIVTQIGAMPDQQLWVNGGFFIMRPDIFKYIHEGEELVEKPFGRLIDEGKLAMFRWEGYW